MSSFRKLALAAAFSATTAPLTYAEMQSPSAARHILNLDDVEIGALIEDVSMVTGFTFVVHPDVKTKRVTVTSQTPMSTDEVFDVFLSTLRVHGFAAVPAGRDTYRIVPEQAAVGEAGTRASTENTFITEIIRLNNFNAVEAAQMVKPLVDAQGQVVANSRSNTLVVVDYASNMDRLRTLVRSLDEDRSVIETVALQNVPAAEMQQILNQLQGSRNNENPATSLTAVASDTSNSIILRGDDMSVARAMNVALELDATDPVRDNLRIVKLNNADASGIVPILEKVGATMAAQRAPGDGSVVLPTVDFHEPTNSLVISASYETLLAMERVIDALDRRRAQVLVEAIIVEMSDDTARELGVQFLLSGTGNSSTPFLSTSFSRSSPNLLALAGALTGGGLTGDDGGSDSSSNAFETAAVNSLLAADGTLAGGFGQDGDTLFGVILNAIERDSESRILSTPFGMALDNATTSLLVGQNVPLTSGEALGSNNQNPFRTVEREDIGVKLDVTPKISDDDSVRLEIFQEVSSIDTFLSSGNEDLILNTRTIQTSVLADDEEIIVLGGLVQQSESLVNSKVPILGDIPGLGRLFRSEGTSYDRTNLVVFIKPTIVRDSDDAASVTAQKYRYVRAEEIFNGEDGDSSLDAFINEVLGSQPPIPSGS
ncbi:MAG: type II secretion system secretin GspD [Pseudomonadota bacterium]